jgi:hypothetical protein
VKKDKVIIKFLELVKNKFGINALSIVDYWNIYDAIGLQRNNKLIYVEHLKLSHFFYECELLSDDPEIVYTVQSTGNDVTEEELLKIIDKFFEVPKRD